VTRQYSGQLGARSGACSNGRPMRRSPAWSPA